MKDHDLGTQVTYVYDAAGNKAQEILSNGDTTTYGYDDLNRLTSVVTQNASGTNLFSQAYTLNDDGTRNTSHEVQRQPDGSDVTVDTAWTYDDDQRLTGESVTSSVTNQSYSDTFGYDLNANRVIDTHTDPGDGASQVIRYTYNGDDQQTASGPDANGDNTIDQATKTVNDYDANGSLTTSTTNGQVTTYTYDLRNKMVGYSGPNGSASYVYDDQGNRVQETANGVTALYLTDTQNPSGYAQPLEQKTAGSSTPSVRYIRGDRVLAQVDGAGTTTFLLIDGHGSTQQLVNASGDIIAAFRYDAFGDAINFTPINSPTVFLFGGDAVYEPLSDLYFHGDGERETRGFLFIQRDSLPESLPGLSASPVRLHKYLYANADSVNISDPSGYIGWDSAVLAPIAAGVTVLEGIESGYANAATNASNYAGGLTAGFAGGATTSVLSFAGQSTALAVSVGQTLTSTLNGVVSHIAGIYGWLGVGASIPGVFGIGIGAAFSISNSGIFLGGIGSFSGSMPYVGITAGLSQTWGYTYSNNAWTYAKKWGATFSKGIPGVPITVGYKVLPGGIASAGFSIMTPGVGPAGGFGLVFK